MENSTAGNQKRIWMDGAFDMFHFGHMNAFRQAKQLSDNVFLVVGINSDESITLCKGKPLMNDNERLDAVKSCKWVDQIVTDVPYIMNEEYVLSIIRDHHIDYIVHGDDPCIVNGRDVYEAAQKLGLYQLCYFQFAYECVFDI